MLLSKFKFKSILTILAAFWSLSSQCANLSTEELRSLSQKMKSASQLSFDFTQTKSTAIRPDKPVKSQGRAVFAKPSKFNWELTKPKLHLIFDGSDLYEIDEANKIASKYQSRGQKTQEIQEVIDVVLDFDSLLQRYKIVESSKTSGQIQLKLEPKQAGLLSQLLVLVDSESAAIKEVSLSFSNKNSTRFEFSNPDRRSVPPSTFQPPKGLKVVDKGL